MNALPVPVGAPVSLELADVQAEPPAIALALDEAGVSDLRYPITIHLADGTHQRTVAKVSFAASVAASVRGVHMSRFVEVMHDWRDRIGVSALLPLLRELTRRLEAHVAVARLDFPLFLERVAPVTDGVAMVVYDCSLECRLNAQHAEYTLTTRVPVTSLCPCSREISDYGAHNQRGSVEISVTFATEHRPQWNRLQDLIEVAEKAGFGARLLPCQETR